MDIYPQAWDDDYMEHTAASEWTLILWNFSDLEIHKSSAHESSSFCLLRHFGD